MTGAEGMIDEQALDWVIRIRDPEFAGWDAFAQWLEQDPAHARAYDAMAAIDADLPALIPAASAIPSPANDVESVPGWRRPWRWVGGGAVAAALVAVLSVGMFDRAAPYSIQTAAGEHREVTLDDGTRIALNGGSTLRLDHNDARFAALDRGEAVFTVTHDVKNPFRLHVGQAILEDAGTVFNVTRDAGITRVGVAEGAVIYNPGFEAIHLPAGRALRANDSDSQIAVRSISPKQVAGWQSGHLSYEDTAVSDIASDFARNLGIRVTVAPAVATARFTGTFALNRDASGFFATAAPLMGLSAVRQADGWLLKEADAPPQ